MVASVHDDERHSWRGLGLAALPPTHVEQITEAVLAHSAPRRGRFETSELRDLCVQDAQPQGLTRHPRKVVKSAQTRSTS